MFPFLLLLHPCPPRIPQVRGGAHIKSLESTLSFLCIIIPVLSRCSMLLRVSLLRPSTFESLCEPRNGRRVVFQKCLSYQCLLSLPQLRSVHVAPDRGTPHSLRLAWIAGGGLLCEGSGRDNSPLLWELVTFLQRRLRLQIPSPYQSFPHCFLVARHAGVPVTPHMIR